MWSQSPGSWMSARDTNQHLFIQHNFLARGVDEQRSGKRYIFYWPGAKFTHGCTSRLVVAGICEEELLRSSPTVFLSIPQNIVSNDIIRIRCFQGRLYPWEVAPSFS